MAGMRTVVMSVPAEADFARTVRMAASTLGVTCGLSVDDVEDVRMAAEEGFVYSCATRPATVEVRFSLSDGTMAMDFSLGEASVSEVVEGDEPAPLDLVELLLSAVCDEHGVNEDGTVLHLLKRAGGADA